MIRIFSYELLFVRLKIDYQNENNDAIQFSFIFQLSFRFRFHGTVNKICKSLQVFLESTRTTPKKHSER